MLQRQHDKAIAEGKKAVALVPSNAWANACLGMFLAYADRPDEAISVSQNALRLNPFPTDWELWFLATSSWEERIMPCRNFPRHTSKSFWIYSHSPLSSLTKL